MRFPRSPIRARASPDVLARLTELKVPFSIATTSGKPRVPVSVVSCGFTDYFPPEAIHSGESDFTPPRFKPDPSVYLLAAESTGAVPENCVAVEDSTSGVGSAANAKIGLIVGYVGGSHIASENEEAHAGTLMAGGRSDDGRGADVVVSDMKDLVPIVEWFRDSTRNPRRSRSPSRSSSRSSRRFTWTKRGSHEETWRSARRIHRRSRYVADEYVPS